LWTRWRLVEFIMQYEFKITNNKFVRSSDKKVFNKTVVLTLYNDKGEENNKDYGFIDRNDVYKLIDEGKEINLDQCYIEDFSLREYRNTKGKNEFEYTEMKDVSAIEAFFNCKNTPQIDFFFAKFVLEKLKKIDFSKTIFGNGNVIFFGVIFDNGFVNFEDIKFGNGDVDFQSADFGNGVISFYNVQFGDGKVNFYDAKFGKGNINFFRCKFGKGELDFSEVKFRDGNVDFSNVEFGSGDVNFRYAEFGNGNISFHDSKLTNGDIDFRDTEFGDGNIYFFNVKFGNGDANFAGSKAVYKFGKGNISFLNTKISKITFKERQFDDYADLRVLKCLYIDLSNTIVRDIIDLKPDSDLRVNIKKLNIIGMQNLGRINIDWKENKVKELIENQGNETTHREKAEQFRILKENFHKIGQYDDEDKAYVEYRKHEMKAVLEERINGKFLNKFWAHPLYWIAWFVKDWLGSFGTNPWRVLANMGIFYFFFSAIYFFLLKLSNCGIYPTNEKVDILTNFCKALYHSAITFLTIGYGDYYPSGIIRIFSGIEGFIGLFLMAYFVVAFSRKVLR